MDVVFAIGREMPNMKGTDGRGKPEWSTTLRAGSVKEKENTCAG